MRTSVVGAVVLLVAVGAAAGVYWRLADRAPLAGGPGAAGLAQPAPGAAMGIPVEAAKVTVTTVAREIVAIGTLRSNESVLVRPEIAGRVARINFAEGERVAKGTVLIALDDSIHRAELRQAETNLDLSRKNYERASELFERRAGTERARDEAFAKLRVDEANVVLARARLEKTVIAAPFDGIVGLRKLSVGDYVAPGQDMVNLESIDPLKADFRVPEGLLAAVREGQPIEVRVDAFATESFAGTVYAIDPLIEAATRSLAVRARIPNADRRLRPGLFSRVTLTVERRPDAIMIPEQAVVPVGESTFVFRIADGVARQAPVRLGLRRDGLVEVVEGLGREDTVVTAGQTKIRDGDRVVVMPPAGG